MINTAARLVRAVVWTFAHHGVKHNDFCCFKGVTYMSPLHCVMNWEASLDFIDSLFVSLVLDIDSVDDNGKFTLNNKFIVHFNKLLFIKHVLW